jgi:tRNA uridine 5-carbamoylmethylation protein Kti12
MEFIMLSGIPTSGKSTFVTSLLLEPYWENAIVLSTDNYIQQVAEKQRKTYNDVYQDSITEATENLRRQMKIAIKDGRDIILDQTNLTRRSRKNKISRIPDTYHKRVVYFEISLEDALERNKHREGKFIPVSVLKQMYYSFEIPNSTENFETIERGNQLNN